ncbi:DUF5000 domain-containing lipoprotein [Chitinophaga sp. 22321]|uniref:DUF4959 domain-containing protein n=1 Tax=Chitinophaga hostae TaxID=2831022 RepID=A0ABS5J5N0_9BACT|nr:DUF5000 domain-containing lipoprotein [Chitinophaga hostae]MBS0029882.1 DUF4959 domain-containing protein [Chitinophaga hostae]
MKKLLYIIAVILITTACKKEGRIDYTDGNTPAPAPISEVKVMANPGGALLTYKIPADPNLSYVKAVYEIREGVFREAKASYYTDTIRLVGFGDTLVHNVQLFSVGKNEKASSPVAVKVQPLRPPVQSTFASITMEATFGGVQIAFKNDAKDNLSITVMLDSTGQNTWTTVNTFYTGAPLGNYSVRGFDITVRKFAVFVRDRWSNKSDTLIKTLKPIYEAPIPKNTWSALRLPTDTWVPAEAYTIEHLWDNNIQGYGSIFASTNSSILPQWFTLDLGKKVVLSRIVEHQISSGHFYAGSAVKKFELWGSNDPSPDGSWDHWELLGSFNSFKPSGLPLGQTSAEDLDYAWFKGEDFSFDRLLPAVRFIRFKTLETYSMSGQIVIAELDLWGQEAP